MKPTPEMIEAATEAYNMAGYSGGRADGRKQRMEAALTAALALVDQSVQERLAEATRLIQELSAHEGAEGWSVSLAKDLDKFFETEPALFEIRDKKEPCAECHIQPGETCDICGATAPVDWNTDREKLDDDYYKDRIDEP